MQFFFWIFLQIKKMGLNDEILDFERESILGESCSFIFFSSGFCSKFRAI